MAINSALAVSPQDLQRGRQELMTGALAQQKKSRQDLMKEILAQQKAGTFNTEARDTAMKAASDLGVTSDQFSKGLERAGVQTPEEQSAVAASKANATQNVMFARAFGSGLDANAAMQNPNYELGSGSALRQAPRQIGTASGAMRREARRLRKEGYAAQAGEMAGLASKTKLAEGSAITRPSDLAGQTMQRIQAGQEALEQEKFKKKYADYASRVMDYRLGQMDREEKKRNPEIKYG